MALDIFIGYDVDEPVCYHVCAESIIRTASAPVSIHPLYLPHLPDVRPAVQEGYAPSNGFSFTRFLVPWLMDFRGRALYLDGDMVVLGDVLELFQLLPPRKALAVVQHDEYQTRQPIKFLGQVNRDYPRKNWSSVMLWDCYHYAHRCLFPGFIRQQTGEYLHRLSWLADELIHPLPKEWNVLADEPGQATDPKLAHYTLGAPCFPAYADCQHAKAWHDRHAGVNYYRGGP